MAGTLGNVATFSFYPSKNLGAFGDGGAIVTDDDEVAALARSLRFHGSRDKENFEYVGYNSRLDEIQAAILRVLLPHLDGWCDGRRAAAAAYMAAGVGEHVAPPVGPRRGRPGVAPVRGHPPPRRRGDGRTHGAGVQARGYYRVPLHRQPAMAPYVDGRRHRCRSPRSSRRRTSRCRSARCSTAEQAREVVAALATVA